jgi:uncharacterized protein with GYD domain
MPTFISLFSWTEPGVPDVKNTAKRAGDFRSSIHAYPVVTLNDREI